MKYCILISLLLSSLSFAQTKPEIYPGETQPLPTESSVIPGETPPVESEFQKTVDGTGILSSRAEEIPVPLPKKTQDRREESTGTAMVGYQFLTTWIPSKFTLSYSHIFSQKWTAELEYSRASYNSGIIGVDLGEITESRFGLFARRYVGNTFHFIMGATHQDFIARVGADVLKQSGASNLASFGAENVAATLGIGNRWQLPKGFTFGVDWFRMNIPIITTKIENDVLKNVDNKSDSDDIKTIIKTFNRIPTFVVLGFNLGYTF